MKSTYFISDLHLDPSQPHLFKLFDDFIDHIQDKAEALYILGDLFEFWIGDDIIDLPLGKPYLPIINKLKALSDSGVKLYFMQGNRDFLAQDKFVKRIGAELLPDQKVIDLYGKPTLIMHGDTLCIDDKAYQRMRAFFRLKIIQKLFLFLSPELRDKIAGDTRKVTHTKIQKKPREILGVNQAEVEKVVKTGGVSLLIHGHTHRPAIHKLSIGSKLAKRVVLGDWVDKPSYLVFSPSSCENIY